MATSLDDTVRHQSGIITRGQALTLGLTDETIESHIAAQRWQRIFRGVFATFGGPLPRPSLLWAAVLRAGPGATLSHETAAELVGLLDRPAARIHVTIPRARTPDPIPGVVIHRSVRAEQAVHPARTPPQTRVEDTVLDLTQTARCLNDALAWMARAVGARLTTAMRLAEALQQRGKVRRRRLLLAGLRDIDLGCHSLIELLYLRDVERAHGLPRAERQRRSTRLARVRPDTRDNLDPDGVDPRHQESSADGGQRPRATVYDDVDYRRYGLLVELVRRPSRTPRGGALS